MSRHSGALLLFLFLTAAAVSGPARGQDQGLEALAQEKAVLEAQHAVLTKEDELATLQEQVLKKVKANRDLKFEILKKEREIEKLKRARRFDVAMEIVSVKFGSNSKTCDATDHVKFKCLGSAPCEVDVNDQMCGDPDPGVDKTATIEILCRPGPGATKKVKKTRSGSKAYLVCD